MTASYTDGDRDTRYPQVPRCDKPFDFPVLERMPATIVQGRGEASTDAASSKPETATG